MKRLFRALALAFALVAAPVGLAACASLAQVSGQQAVAKADEQSLLVAEMAFDGALSVVEAADTAGALTPERARAVLPRLQEARAALVQARALYDANQDAEAEIAAGRAYGAVARFVAVLVELGFIERS